MSRITASLLQGLTQASCSITEYRLVNDRVAQVLVQVASDEAHRLDKTAVMATLASALNNAASPIENSFRWLVPGHSMLGYVAAVNATRLIEDPTKVEAQGYRLIASNLYLDKNDESLWELKSGAGGRYLARQGRDDLTELIEASRVSPRGSMPRMHSVAAASAAPQTVVAFVNSNGLGTPFVDYGFCVGHQGEKSIIASADSSHPILVSPLEIVGVYGVDTSAVREKVVSAAKVEAKAQKLTSAKMPTSDSIEYYKKLYFYAPDYLKKVIKEIEEQAAL